MANINLAASRREITGKSVKKLRRDGIIPIVVYGGPVDGAISLQANERELSRVLASAGATQVVTLTVDKEIYPVLARVAQRHPTRHELVHVDFLAVDLTQMIQAQVPVVLVGETPTVNLDGAVLLQATDSLTVEALPNDIPVHIEVDISVFTEFGQVITVADLPENNAYRVVTDEETVLASVIHSAGSVSEEDEEAEEAGVVAEEAEEADGSDAVDDGEDA